MLNSMFRSARLKLTLFYLAILLAFSLAVTLTMRVLAEQEYMRSNYVQQSQLRELTIHVFDFDRRPDVVFADTQKDEAALVRHHLNQALIAVNIIAMSLGGLLSYWFAGRTLRPIEEAHEAQARFAADASHELRTPLTNMKLENEIFLRQKEFDAAEARELITSNLEEIQRLETLSSNLLALAQYGQVSLTRTPVPIKQVVKAARTQLSKTIEAKRVRVEQHLPDAAVLVHKDSAMQLVAIVLDNALKYGPVGGAVKLTGKAQGGRYVLSVQDEGPGLDPDDLPHIFDRLYRGDKARTSKVGGYGLGLALAREIANANEAVIVARNAQDGGALFEITFEATKGT